MNFHQSKTVEGMFSLNKKFNSTPSQHNSPLCRGIRKILFSRLRFYSLSKFENLGCILRCNNGLLLHIWFLYMGRLLKVVSITLALGKT